VTYEFVTRHAVTANGNAATLDNALRAVTFADVPLVRALVFARGLGLPRGDQNVLEALGRRGTVVEDVPGKGLSVSLNGQFWRLRGRGPEPAATAVVRFRAEDGLLSTETRVHVPPASRRRFVRYWRIVRPFSGLIRRAVLQAAKRRAEA
jgi:membrane protein implicated in regulation of membrane protease activity